MSIIFKGKRTTLSPTRIIQVERIIRTFYGLIIKVKEIGFWATHLDFSNKKKKEEVIFGRSNDSMYHEDLNYTP